MSRHYENSYDHYEVYWGCERNTWELFQLIDPDNQEQALALAHTLIGSAGTPPEDLALLLRANMHAFAREFNASYGLVLEPTEQERECERRGWAHD